MARYYKRMPIWENRQSVRTLTEYRRLVLEYFADLTYAGWAAHGPPDEGEQARSVRPQLNRLMGAVHLAVQRAGYGTTHVIYPAPAVGGAVRNVDVITNLFFLYQDREVVTEQHTIDAIDRALGTYDRDFYPSIVRTLNPFFWVSVFIGWVSTWPFVFVGRLGLDRAKVESSWIGMAFKGLLQVTLWISLVLSGLNLLGQLHIIKDLLK